jgi:hypothetical protein
VLERRAKHRAKIALSASADFPGIGASEACVVLNLSVQGACVAFAPGTKAPRLFELRIGPDPISHTVRVIWRSQHTVGVAFLQPRNAPDVFHQG